MQRILYFPFVIFVGLSGFLLPSSNMLAQGSSEALADSSRPLGKVAHWRDQAFRILQNILEYELYSIDGHALTIETALTALLLFALGWFFSRKFTAMLRQRILGHFKIHEGAVAAIESIIFYLLVVFFALFALRLAHIPLTIFTFLGGAIAIGVGFGSQNLLNNFISGLILLIEQPIRVGDLIEVSGLNGRILRIGLRSTIMRSSGNIDMIVPNSTLLQSNVTNWTLGDPTVRLNVTVGVAYGSPTETVMETLLSAANEVPAILKTPEPVCWFRDFGNDALIFEVNFWAVIRSMKDKHSIESDMRMVIDRLFREAGLVIAFPQRDVHLDTHSKPLDVRVVSESAAKQ